MTTQYPFQEVTLWLETIMGGLRCRKYVWQGDWGLGSAEHKNKQSLSSQGDHQK